MPTYDYECDACGHQMEVFQGINDPVKKKCPECGTLKLKRLIGPGAAVVFKGSGFYQTDYRSEGYKKAADADSGGWPQTPRNNAIDIIRKSQALHINGDQHLATLSQYGVAEQRDSNWAFCTPAISAGYPRWWRPDELGMPHENRPAHNLPNTGEFLDGFGNRITVRAIGNPVVSGREPARLYDRAPGYGIVRMNKENTAPFATFLYTNGGSWLDADGKPAFNRPEAVEALEFYGKMAREYGPPGASALGWKEVVGAMAQGKAAMTVEISIFANLILENPKKSKAAGKLGYAMIPPGKTGQHQAMLPLNMWHLSSFSQKKEAAWYLLQYLSMKEQIMSYKMAGLPMTRLSAWQDPKWKAKDRLPQLTKLQVEALHNGRIGFEIPIARFTEARPILQRVIYTGYEGGDVQKAADIAAKEIERILD